MSRLIIFLLVTSAFLPLITSSGLFDFDQCDRRCRYIYGRGAGDHNPEITGYRLNMTQTCQCIYNGTDVGVIDRLMPKKIPVMPEHACCGADGKNYATQQDACAAGTYPLHGGYCGACSNVHDINIYNITRHNMTNITTKCAAEYVLFGYNASYTCEEDSVGMTSECTACWIDNAGCDAAQCLEICAWVRATGQPPNKPDGSLNDCLACDEMYCGEPFIECAGANRRRSGIPSSIHRPNDTIWKRYAC